MKPPTFATIAIIILHAATALEYAAPPLVGTINNIMKSDAKKDDVIPSVDPDLKVPIIMIMCLTRILNNRVVGTLVTCVVLAMAMSVAAVHPLRVV